MIWAVALSMLSAASYAVAAVVQERLAAAGHHGIKRWFWALLLTGVGAGLHVAALGFGTVGVVQALGTLTLLFAMPVAAVRRRMPIPARAWRDAGFTVAGLAAFMALTAEPGGPAVLAGHTGRNLAIGTAAVVAALASAAVAVSTPVIRGVLLAGASGTAFAMASVFSKAVISSFTFGMALVVAVFAVGGYLIGQLSYRGAGLAAPLAMVSVSNPVVAGVVGVLVFDEGFRFGIGGVVGAVAAGVVAAIGVVGLSRRQAQVAAADGKRAASEERAPAQVTAEQGGWGRAASKEAERAATEEGARAQAAAEDEERGGRNRKRAQAQAATEDEERGGRNRKRARAQATPEDGEHGRTGKRARARGKSAPAGKETRVPADEADYGAASDEAHTAAGG